MDYRKLGRTGLKVSELCLGTMTFRWTSSEADSIKALDRAWEAGINFIDTADVYSRWATGNPGGVAEEIIGDWMKSKPREQIVLATKVCGEMWPGPNGQGLSRGHIMTAVENSLRRLKTDYIDLYQSHRHDWDTPQEETLRAYEDLIRQGKVRYLGASNFRPWVFTKALWISDVLKIARYETLQPHFHLLNRAEVEPDFAGLCLAEGIAVIPYSPLAGGFLTGKYTREQIPSGSRGENSERLARYMNDLGWQVLDALREIGAGYGKTIAQTALAWQLSLPFITAPIIGANTVEQLDESLGAVGYRLSEDEMSRFDAITGINRRYGA